jgi:hypothetical protein
MAVAPSARSGESQRKPGSQAAADRAPPRGNGPAAHRERRAHIGGAVRARYRPGLRATVAASAAPYGYTLTIWTSGAVLSHARGIPSAAAALLFLAGAVCAYAAVAAAATAGGFRERLVPAPAHAVVWGGLHLFSVGVAIGAASLAAHLVTGLAAWPLGGFCATALYLVVSAGQLAIADAARRVKAQRPVEGQSRRQGT